MFSLTEFVVDGHMLQVDIETIQDLLAVRTLTFNLVQTVTGFTVLLLGQRVAQTNEQVGDGQILVDRIHGLWIAVINASCADPVLLCKRLDGFTQLGGLCCDDCNEGLFASAQQLIRGHAEEVRQCAQHQNIRQGVARFPYLKILVMYECLRLLA